MIFPQKAGALAQRPGVRQFLKFGIVGASSTIINLVVLKIMLDLLPEANPASRYIAVTIAFLVSAVNGYIWNRRWTFRGAAEKAVHAQFTQFVLVNLVGLGLDLLIVRLLSVPLEHQFHFTMKIATIAAQLAATALIVFWNFFANRFWTFKH